MPKSVNLVVVLAGMFGQMLKVINSVTINIGHQLVDTIVELIQGPCKENQRSFVNAKVVDSSREFISLLSLKDNLPALGFVRKPDDSPDDEEEDMLDVMDEFLSKISVILLSLLEGEEDIEICQKMAFSISIEDIKDRMLNVFGVFLHTIKLFPVTKLKDD